MTAPLKSLAGTTDPVPMMAPTARTAPLMLVALLSAEILANVTLIVGQPLDGIAVLLVALPVAALATVVLALTRRWVPSRWLAALVALTSPRRQVLALVAGSVLALGLYASNRFLTDLPLGPRTRIGYGLGALAALGALLAARPLLRRPAVREWLVRIPHWTISIATVGLCGLLAAVLDDRVLPPGFPRLHVAATAAAAAAFSLVALLFVRHMGGRAAITVVALNAVLLAAIALLGREWRRELLTTRTPWVGYWRVIDSLRLAGDGDGDGYGELLGGEDCDDGDARAYPLSAEGRDCLGWVPAGTTPPRAPVIAPQPPKGPGIVVLLTIDTFRCGFGGRLPERRELTDACPRLTAMAGEGRARLDAHTRAPVTEPSLAAMHLGPPRGDRASLAALLGQVGFRSHAILTHRVLLASEGLRASFGSLDAALIPVAAPPGAVTAPQVTDRALAWLRQAETSGDKLFLWAHYLDPHAPYAVEPDATFVFDQVAAYAAEIRRTDREIGRLVDGLRSLRRAHDVLVMVTADHGEEFGLHRLERHSVELYETAVRVPFIAWSPGEDPARFVTGPLPGSLVEVRPFVMATLGGARFTPRPDRVMVTLFNEDRQVAILRDGWKLIRHLRPGYDELYDLTEDPWELRDLALRHPEQVQRLGALLGAEVRRDPSLQALLRIR